ncbi:DUF3313 domain-containing protein [Pararobbsia alpina]|uniref:DUF3313 domain-containing protein n=1 Tax=Pararobbsia alpina TaxID=621374 RepID=UPI0039A6CE89
MAYTNGFRLLFIAAACTAVVGCSSVEPVKYSGIDSSNYLRSNMSGDADRVPYRYNVEHNWQTYKKLMIDPVVVYHGQDNQFDGMSDTDKTELAKYMSDTFAKKLGTRFELAHEPSPATLRMTLTLTGAEGTTPFLGQFTHFDIGGTLYNGVQAARGGKALFGGSVTYAVEVRDATTNELLYAEVAHQYPNAMNIGAAFGSLGAAKTGIDKGAEALAARFN